MMPAEGVTIAGAFIGALLLVEALRAVLASL